MTRNNDSPWAPAATSSSKPRSLVVTRPMDRDPRFPRPVLTEVTDGELRLSDGIGDLHVAVTKWPLIATGQTVWIWIEFNGSQRIDLVTAHKVTSNESDAGLFLGVPRRAFEAIPDWASCFLHQAVALDGSLVERDAIRFPRGDEFRLRRNTSPPFYIDPSAVTLAVGQSYLRNASGGTSPYRYVSSHPSVVRVPSPSAGTIQGAAAGSARITASDADGSSASYEVTVRNPLYIDPSSVSLFVGQGYARQASGGTAPYGYVSSNPAVVRVTSFTSGAIQGMAAGSAQIIVTDAGGSSAGYPVTIQDVPDPWLDDLTTFAGDSYQGWAPGAGARSGRPQFIQQLGRTGFFNSTDGGGNFSGTVVDRTFPVTRGATYEVRAVGVGSAINSAIITVYADGQPIIRSVTLNGAVTIGPGTMVASNTTLKIDIANEQATGAGNDFGITDIRVRRIA